MSILKEVSQKCFVFDLQSFIFEGSLAEKLRFWISNQFWRKSRRNASFLIFKASFLKEVSQKSFVLELQSFNFEGSLAEMLGFGVSKFRFLGKSRRIASFLIFKASFLKEVSHKSFVFELNFVFEGSLAEKLRSSKLQFWRKSRRKALFDNQITWTSNHLTSKSLESQINWQPTHLNLKSIDNQITWISDQLTTESVESQPWSSSTFKRKVVIERPLFAHMRACLPTPRTFVHMPSPGDADVYSWWCKRPFWPMGLQGGATQHSR